MRKNDSTISIFQILHKQLYLPHSFQFFILFACKYHLLLDNKPETLIYSIYCVEQRNYFSFTI